jgi:hypothetical protein
MFVVAIVQPTSTMRAAGQLLSLLVVLVLFASTHGGQLLRCQP